MLQEKHIKQVSQIKLDLYVDKLYKEILDNIKIQSNYFNDIEQAICLILLGEKILGVCEKSLEEQDVQLVRDYFAQERKKHNRNEQQTNI